MLLTQERKKEKGFMWTKPIKNCGQMLNNTDYTCWFMPVMLIPVQNVTLLKPYSLL